MVVKLGNLLFDGKGVCGPIAKSALVLNEEGDLMQGLNQPQNGVPSCVPKKRRMPWMLPVSENVGGNAGQ